MDIKNFNNEKINDFIEKNQNFDMDDEQKQSFEDIKAKYGDDISNLIDKFHQMDESELITEIFRIINEKKQNGTFNPDDLDKIAEMIKPLLTEEQKMKMNNLIDLIKWKNILVQYV